MVPRFLLSPDGPEVSSLAFGLWRLAADPEGTSPSRVRRKIDACLAAGITTFDHADIYGLYTCEGLFGRALAEEPSLRDRMEIIQIPGYTEAEKVQIAKRYILPKQRENHGLKESQVTIPDETMVHLIRHYTREAGVRNAEREIATLMRKVARGVAEKKIRKGSVDLKKLATWLGPERHEYGEMDNDDQVGSATGLVVTPVGGDVVTVEVGVMEGREELILTGQLGDVMKESARAALSYAKKNALRFGIPLEKFDKSDIHIHVPAGAIPKEGPSAGVALVSALVSALTEVPVRHDIAMTGEITLTGRVLPIGGVKEKVLGARRAGIREVSLPKLNEPDLSDIPKPLRQNMTFHFVEHLDQVLDLALVGGLKALEERGRRPRSARKKKELVAHA